MLWARKEMIKNQAGAATHGIKKESGYARLAEGGHGGSLAGTAGISKE